MDQYPKAAPEHLGREEISLGLRVCLSGPAGSGKSTVAEILEKRHGFVRASLSGIVREECARRGLAEDRAALQAVGDELRGSDPARLAVLAEERVRNVSGPVVIEGVRLRAEGAYLKGRGFVGVRVLAPEPVRRMRVLLRDGVDGIPAHRTETEALSVQVDLVVVNDMVEMRVLAKRVGEILERALHLGGDVATERRLGIEFAAPTWDASIRRVLPREVWDRLRGQVFGEAGCRCQVCGARGKLYCQERWAYDDQRHAQTLVCLLTLCERCHRIKDWGETEVLVGKGRLRLVDVFEHYQRVNGVDRAVFEADVREAKVAWFQRAQQQWRIDWSLLGRRFGVDVAQCDGETALYADGAGR